MSNYDNREERLVQCDCCGQRRYGCVDTTAYGLDVTACPECRGEDYEEYLDQYDIKPRP